MVPNDEVDSSLRRFGTFLMNPLLEQIFGQTETTIPFQQIVDESLTFLVKLPNDDDVTTSLIATVIFQELFNATVNRTTTDPYLIIVDECQLVTTPDLARFIDEARKRNVGICLATQRPGKVGDERVQQAMMNVGTLVALTLDYDDAYPIGKRFTALSDPKQAYVRIPHSMTKMSEVRENGHPNPYVVSLIRELDAVFESQRTGQQVSPDSIDWRPGLKAQMERYDDLIEWHQTHTDPGSVLGSRLMTSDMYRYRPELYQRSRQICLSLYPLLQNEPTIEPAGIIKQEAAHEQIMGLQRNHGWGAAAVRMSDDVFLMTIAKAEEAEPWNAADFFRQKAIEYGNILPRAEVAAETRSRLDNNDDDEPPSVTAPVPKSPTPPKPYDLPVTRRARKA